MIFWIVAAYGGSSLHCRDDATDIVVPLDHPRNALRELVAESVGVEAVIIVQDRAERRQLTAVGDDDPFGLIDAAFAPHRLRKARA